MGEIIDPDNYVTELTRTSAAAASFSLAPDPEVPEAKGTIIGGYALRQPVAAGGFAMVYEAAGPEGQRVAIKILRKSLVASNSAVRRFIREAEVLAQLQHPNIVHFEDSGSLPDGRHYLVMELLDGPTLSGILRANGRLSPIQILEILEPICAALQVAHQAGCIHRDIKGSNIGTVVIDGERVVKLLDFGVAKLLEPEPGHIAVTRAGQRIGSLLTTAPEQLTGGEVSPMTDIYALGVLVYRMLTGLHPFYSPDEAELEQMHLTTLAPRPSNIVPISKAIDDVVVRCLEKTPHARYPSAEAFLNALRDATRKAAPVSEWQVPAYALYTSVTALAAGSQKPTSQCSTRSKTPSQTWKSRLKTQAFSASSPPRTGPLPPVRRRNWS